MPIPVVEQQVYDVKVTVVVVLCVFQKYPSWFSELASECHSFLERTVLKMDFSSPVRGGLGCEKPQLTPTLTVTLFSEREKEVMLQMEEEDWQVLLACRITQQPGI